jgi:hypothetical protein
VFVEVTDNNEHVVVAKRGSSIVVDVNDHGDIVRVRSFACRTKFNPRDRGSKWAM